MTLKLGPEKVSFKSGYQVLFYIRKVVCLKMNVFFRETFNIFNLCDFLKVLREEEA